MCKKSVERKPKCSVSVFNNIYKKAITTNSNNIGRRAYNLISRAVSICCKIIYQLKFPIVIVVAAVIHTFINRLSIKTGKFVLS